MTTRTRIPCPDCNELFLDEDTLDAHQRSEAERHPPSVRFLKGPPLPKCLNESTLYSIGWRKPRSPQGGKQGVWSKPPMPKRRPYRIDEHETWNCLSCKKKFKDVTPFLAHFVHTFTPIERCLDTDELRALDYEESKGGVWRASIATQLLPSQVNRLASVRQELASFERAESVKRELAELAGGYPSSPPRNLVREAPESSQIKQPISSAQEQMVARTLANLQFLSGRSPPLSAVASANPPTAEPVGAVS